jgi:hypothetical protein
MLQCTALGLGQPLASAALVAAHSLRIWSMSQTSAAPYSTGAPTEPVELTVSEDLLSKVTDKELLRTGGLIGGKWTQATSRATFHVSCWCQQLDPGIPAAQGGHCCCAHCFMQQASKCGYRATCQLLFCIIYNPPAVHTAVLSVAQVNPSNGHFW